MQRLAALFILMVAPACAQQITAVSAASYQPIVAPNSLASLFGSGLALSKASAKLDSTGQLPTTLGGVTIEVNNVKAPLIYVSPQQLNFVVPQNTELGTANVVVETAASLNPFQGTMQVQQVAPAVFSLDASGQGNGAILNAVTFAGQPFLVETSQNTGGDKRTRLAIYATGVRYAGNATQNPSMTNVANAITVEAQDTTGRQYDVEYAGAAPGFFGLDQINVILPPDADGAGTVSLIVAAGNAVSNTVTFQMGSLPQSQVHVAGLTLTQTSVTSGQQLTGTVSLNARARLGGYSVRLGSSNGLALQTPSTLVVPEGQASATFMAQANTVGVTSTVTITAAANGFSESQTIQVLPPNAVTLTGLTLGAATVQGGQTVTGTVTLSGSNTLGGVQVGLASSDTSVGAPANVQIPFGQASGTFTLTTSKVTEQKSVTLRASYGASTATATLTVNPALTFTLTPATVTGGNSVSGLIALALPAPNGGALVSLTSSDVLLAMLPANVTVPAGQTSVTFSIPTLSVTSPRTVILSVEYAGVQQPASLAINPAGLPAPARLSLNPNVVQGGSSVTGTISLTAPAPPGGLIVDLTSDNPFAVQLPILVTVPSGQSAANFTIGTGGVVSAQTATITATAGGVSVSATLQIQ